MTFKVSRRGDVPPFMVMDVMTAAARREAAGHRVIHMEVGQPSTPAPRRVLEAAHRALDEEVLGYTLALGLPQLRERIADYYRETAGLDLPVERIAVTAGSLGGFLLAFLGAFEHGDRVAMPRPSYPSYRNMLGALGIEPVWVETTLESGFQPTPEDLDRVDVPLDGLIVASPSNPVGSMIAPGALERLARYCEDRGIRLISDEIYHGLTYATPAVPAVCYSDSAISLNSFSKYYSMTGWRLGWMVMPELLVRQIERLAQNFFICPSAPAQRAAVAAFDCREELDGHVRVYARNRELLLRELPGIGFDRIAPADGAFYLYADIAHLTDDSLDFAARMLEQAGVATTSGVDFDPVDGHTGLRFSYARSTAEIEEAVARLRRWMGAQ
ncbi:MAG: aminotransferase class I/II-fold pyridoxal phosphate-dependent enzyme [Candidatus Competibacterales bacterium]|nr:aminotransferase class I/II-fold pyridoxal phosphate-dependent enzyme [Candidatus Competibacterales bacterium]